MGAGGNAGDNAVSGLLKKVLEVGTSIFSPLSCSAAKYLLTLLTRTKTKTKMTHQLRELDVCKLQS